MDFSVDCDPGSGRAVIICAGRLDVNNSRQLRDILNDAVARSCYKIVLDLSQIQYMDSSGLGAVVSRIADLRSNGGDVRIAGAKNHVAGLFKLTHLDKVIKLFDNVDNATASFTE